MGIEAQLKKVGVQILAAQWRMEGLTLLHKSALLLGDTATATKVEEEMSSMQQVQHDLTKIQLDLLLKL